MAKRWWAWAGTCAVFAFSGTARAGGRGESVAAEPAAEAQAVAADSHPIRVGDVIMAPLVDPPAERAERHEPASLSARKPKQQRAWYGQPVLLSDALAAGFIILSAEYEQVASVTLPIGIGTYVLMPPLIHVSVGNWAQALVSGGVRLGLPFAGAIVGAAVSCSDGDGSCGQGVLGFTVTGMLAATLFDVAFLSFEKLPQPRAVRPALALGRSHALVGASGEF